MLVACMVAASMVVACMVAVCMAAALLWNSMAVLVFSCLQIHKLPPKKAVGTGPIHEVVELHLETVLQSSDNVSL